MPKHGHLEAYRKKRAAGATTEPFGAEGAIRPGLFVVQQHDATRLHYDFRLEVDGVLRSWAVPKGPSLDPDDKRLAVETEDHPVEYGDFEGVIPKGNYGAGAVILWDRGPTIHHLEPAQAIEDGKLLFELRGYKLRGLWTLVRTSRNPKEWLLIKKPDGAATGETVEELPAQSVLSGLTVDEMRDGSDRAERIEAQLEEAGAERKRLDPAAVEVQLAELWDDAFTEEGWLFEIKYDGYRAVLSKSPAKGGDRGRSRPETAIRYRSGLDATARFPDLDLALRSLPFDRVVLDGEIVTLDEEGKPTFGRLQKRALLNRRPDIERAAVENPATYFAFDLLGFGDFDLRGLPLSARKEFLARVLPPTGPLKFVEHIPERGEDFYQAVRGLGLEGVVAKRAAAKYVGRRTPDWRKIRAARTGDFAVLGYTQPKGSRSGFGALHLGVLIGARMVYAGRVGTGFSDRQLKTIRESLDPFRRKDPPVTDGAPPGKEHVWVEPRLVAEVRYTEYTDAGQLRHPVFVRMRQDKSVGECVRDDLPPVEEDLGTSEPATAPPPKVEVTRPEKVFWPDEGYTKGDLIGYYRAVADRLLPFLRDRPVILDRYPDGIEGKSFFQKNAPDFAPEWIRQEPVWSEDSGKETRYFVCNDVETLTYLINSGAIPLHVWSSRITAPQAPDWCVVDLDAKDAEFRDVVKVARAIHRLTREIDLPTYVKTSGATGLHIMIPLGGQCTHEQSRQLANILCTLVARQLPEIASTARTPARRKGKVYLDALQNGYGKLIVAPYSARPLPGAPCSAPLRWNEVTQRLDPRKHTIASLPARVRRQRADPLAAVLTDRPDIGEALARLAAGFEE